MNSTSTADGEPTLKGDLLLACLHSDRAGGLGLGDIWCAARDCWDEAFGKPADQRSLNSSGFDSDPAVTTDGAEIFFWSDRSGGPGKGDLYHGSWNSLGNQYVNPQLLAELSTSSREWGPAPTPDALTLYFTSDRPGGAGDMDIWRATRETVRSPFGQPENVTELNSPDGELNPSLTVDGQVIVFGRYGGGLWISDKGANGTWGTPVQIMIDNAPVMNAAAPRIAADGSLYFGRGLSTDPSSDIWVAEPVW